MINEVCGARTDCRNILSIPVERKINIEDLNKHLKSNLIFSIYNHEFKDEYSKYIGTSYGSYITNEYNNVKSYKFNNNIHLFCFHDRNHTKIIAIDVTHNTFILGKYLIEI